MEVTHNQIYNNLVHDRIFEIIEVFGAECKIKILFDEEYLNIIDFDDEWKM